MRTNEPAIERPKQFFHTRVDRVHLCLGNQRTPDAALIGDYADAHARGTKRIEATLGILERFDTFRIAIVWNIDDDGPVAVDEDPLRQTQCDT
jgi:hypothetical protein